MVAAGLHIYFRSSAKTAAHSAWTTRLQATWPDFRRCSDILSTPTSRLLPWPLPGNGFRRLTVT
jgi:hypothetical protein